MGAHPGAPDLARWEVVSCSLAPCTACAYQHAHKNSHPDPTTARRHGAAPQPSARAREEAVEGPQHAPVLLLWRPHVRVGGGVCVCSGLEGSSMRGVLRIPDVGLSLHATAAPKLTEHQSSCVTAAAARAGGTASPSASPLRSASMSTRPGTSSRARRRAPTRWAPAAEGRGVSVAWRKALSKSHAQWKGLGLTQRWWCKGG